MSPLTAPERDSATNIVIPELVIVEASDPAPSPLVNAVSRVRLGTVASSDPALQETESVASTNKRPTCSHI